MDALDVRILRTMAFRPFEHAPKHPDVLKPAHIARVVGTTSDTVKARLQHMEEKGLVGGYGAVPNLSHLGLAAAGYYLEFPDTEAKDRAMPHVAAIPGVLELHDFIGNGLCVDLAFDPESGSGATTASMQLAASAAKASRFYEHHLPRVDRDLTRLDWRILLAVRKDAKRSLTDVAAELGVTRRTVKRRLERLVTEGSVFFAPRLDPSHAEGVLLVEMLFFLTEEGDRAAMRRVAHAFDADHLFGYVPSTRHLGHFNLLCVARSPAHVEDMRRHGTTIPGVKRVEAWPFRRFVDASRWLDEAIAERTGIAP